MRFEFEIGNVSGSSMMECLLDNVVDLLPVIVISALVSFVVSLIVQLIFSMKNKK